MNSDTEESVRNTNSDKDANQSSFDCLPAK